MVIKLYLSRTCGNIMMKVEQEYIRRILESKNIDYEEIDISDPHQIKEKEFMQNALKADDRVILPPQLFNDNTHSGDFLGFFRAVETECLFRFLGLEAPKTEVEYLRLHKKKTEHETMKETAMETCGDGTAL